MEIDVSSRTIAHRRVHTRMIIAFIELRSYCDFRGIRVGVKSRLQDTGSMAAGGSSEQKTDCEAVKPSQGYRKHHEKLYMPAFEVLYTTSSPVAKRDNTRGWWCGGRTAMQHKRDEGWEKHDSELLQSSKWGRRRRW